MTRRKKAERAKPRVADEIMSGIRELQKIMDQNRRPEELFTVHTVKVHQTNAKPGTVQSRSARQLL